MQSGLPVYIWIKRFFGTSLKEQVKEKCPKISNIDSLTDTDIRTILLTGKCPLASISGKCFRDVPGSSKLDFKPDGTGVMKRMNNGVETITNLTYSQEDYSIRIRYNIGTWDGRQFIDLIYSSKPLEPCDQTSSGTQLAGKCFDGGRLQFNFDNTVTLWMNQKLMYTLSGNNVFIHEDIKFDGGKITFMGTDFTEC
jgi:hypothetical protein